MSLPQFERTHVSAYDGTRLEMQTFGDGDLTLLIANGLGGTLLAWAPLLRALEHEVRFVSWDYRGLYGSGKPASPALDVETHVRDMRVVMDASGTDRCVVAGWSMGVQVCVQAAIDLSHRIDGLVLINGTYGRAFDTAFDLPVVGGAVSRALPWINLSAAAAGPLLNPLIGGATRLSAFPRVLEAVGLVDENLDKEVFVAIAKGFEKLDFRVYHRIMDQLQKHDGEPLLSRITQPTLFIAGQRDRMTPASIRHVFEREMPNVESFIVPRGTHYSLIEYPEQVVDRIREYLSTHHAAQFPAAAND